LTGIIQKVDFPVPGGEASEILYAAAFIHPAVEDVTLENGVWNFSLSQAVEMKTLEDGLKKLAERFSSATEFDSEPVFVLKAISPEKSIPPDLFGKIVQEIYPGLFVFREPVSTLIRFLDHEILKRFAGVFGASEEIYPNCIPISAIGKAEHLSSFPEHLHFLTHISQDLDILDAFAESSKKDKGKTSLSNQDLSPVELVHNPSTCYHCYASREGTVVAENTAITAITKCHRFEAANHKDFGRLLEFSMREIIFLGHPDYVRECRERSLELIKKFAEDWQLFGELLQSNDPFFTSDFSAKAGQQQRMAMKYEYQMAIPGQEKKLSVLSSNLHGVTFGKAFSIKRPGGPMHTGCLAFGIERMALSIIAQHGTDADKWPGNLAAQFAAWAQ